MFVSITSKCLLLVGEELRVVLVETMPALTAVLMRARAPRKRNVRKDSILTEIVVK